MSASLLIEIGCEEIPARMIPEAARDLAARVLGMLEQAGLGHGEFRSLGGARRLAVHVAEVEPRQTDREETIVGPPARAAFTAAGEPTAAAVGFARKQGVDPSDLLTVETEKGVYAGFTRRVRGRTLGEVLAQTFSASVEGMSFPKTMRWGDGRCRWVRPVHSLLALYGSEVLPLELFGVRAGRTSFGHRFLAPGPVQVETPDTYVESLRAAFVLADPAERRRRLSLELAAAAAAEGGDLVEDCGLLEEAVGLVEWPRVVVGRFDAQYRDLPRALLITTLRHHQKAFAVEAEGRLLPVFFAVAGTDRDPAGHVRRGNEWVVGGRLEDAQFFWREDRRTPLASRLGGLRDLVFHAKCGTYADKAARLEALTSRIALRLGWSETDVGAAREAARLAKADLTTGLVGEFPELQGVVGALMLRAEGANAGVAAGIEEHYRPLGPDDSVPASLAGCIVSVADKLDAVSQLIPAGEVPTGSRDPLGLRRALNGAFRIVDERGWPLALGDLESFAGGHVATAEFLRDRYTHYLRERGYTLNEILATTRPRISETAWTTWPLADMDRRLQAIKTVRGREDFEHLVDLTKRVDNIQTKSATEIREAAARASGLDAYFEREPCALELSGLVEECAPKIRECSEAKRYAETVEIISRFIDPVERFFQQVLVIDSDHPEATVSRSELLARTKALLTTTFDIRELAGQAERRS